MKQLSLSSLKGYLLLQAPYFLSHNLPQQVIFLFSHNTNGAVGLALSHPIDPCHLEDMSDSASCEASLSLENIHVYDGGNTERDQSFILHTNDYLSHQSVERTEHFSLTPSQNFLPPKNKEPHHFLIALGYMSWVPGALEEEFQNESWFVMPATSRLIFDTPAQDKWHAGMNALGISQPCLTARAGHA